MEQYDFESMANEAYQLLDQSNSGDLLILPEIILDISITRLHWKNVKVYLRVIQRNPDYFIDFLKHQIPGKEISWFSGSKSDGLIVHGLRQKKNEITELARKFVNDYVVCTSCKKADTCMNKLNSKTYEIICNDCGNRSTCIY
jgi:translation initiation factor 2 beta subunit (eIF-2beta)/eIF-5